MFKTVPLIILSIFLSGCVSQESNNLQDRTNMTVSNQMDKKNQIIEQLWVSTADGSYRPVDGMKIEGYENIYFLDPGGLLDEEARLSETDDIDGIDGPALADYDSRIYVEVDGSKTVIRELSDFNPSQDD